MTESNTLETIQLIVGLIIWVIILFAIRFALNKTFISERRINPKSKNFSDEFYNELQLFYHIEETDKDIILKSETFSDLVTQGFLTIEARNKDDPKSIKITYHRKIKLSGYFIIMFSLMLCYVGVLIPVLIVQNTKKRTLEEIDKIYTISKSI